MIGKATPGGSGFGGGSVGRLVTGGNGVVGGLVSGGTTSPGSSAMKLERRNQSAGLLAPTPPERAGAQFAWGKRKGAAY